MEHLKIPFFVILALITFKLNAQIKIGITYGGDFYQNYKNPKVKGDSLGRSSGNYWLNIAMGPKIWYKGCNYSISLESQANWGITAFDLKENKGMGNLAFPIMVKYNTGLLEGHKFYGLNEYSIGVGIQYNKTEIYGFKDKYKNHHPRGYFRTYFVDLSMHTLSDSPSLDYLYIRFGLGEQGALCINIGMMWDKVF
jgi:hypothetical protein